MRQVLTAAPDDATAAAHDVAEAMARITHAETRTVDTGPSDPRDADAFLAEMARPDAVLGVITPDPAHRAAAWRVVQRASKPVIIVPPGFVAPTPAISRVLVPLDGTRESARTVQDAMRLFADADVELTVLHVFDTDTTPMFWDQAAHARNGWEQGFRELCCVPPHTRIELRRGLPGQRVVEVAASEHSDLVALGWSQNLGPGRARTVRSTVAQADIPVLLVPIL